MNGNRRGFTRIAALLILGVAVTAAPFALAREAPPEGGQPRDFKIPETTRIELDNGLTAILVPYGTLPKVTISVQVRSGNLNEKPDEVWLADLTGRMMEQGTKDLDSQGLAAAFAGMGGELGISVGTDVTTHSTDVLSEFGPDAVAYLADVVRTPRLPGSETERIKADLLRQLSIAMTGAQPMADQKFYAVLYGDHPYGRRYPREDQLRGYTIDDVRKFHAAQFGARRTHVYVVGMFDPAAMEQAIRDSFEDWEAGPEPLTLIPEPDSVRAVYLIDREGAPQSTVRIGLPVVDPSDSDYTALTVTNTLLGGSFTSRVTSNIREDKGYTYSPRSSVTPRYRAAHWVQSADVTTSVTGASLKEIFFEIDRLQSEAPPANELRGVQNYLAGVFVLQNSSRSGIVRQLAFVEMHGLSLDYLTGLVQRIYAVTPEDVQRIAKTHLRDDEMTVVVVGDRKQIVDQLRPFGKLIE